VGQVLVVVVVVVVVGALVLLEGLVKRRFIWV
jgi:hypothetical protein